MELIVKKRIKQVIQGDQSAFEEIVELYKTNVFYICYRMIGNRYEAEDLAQEAFIRAYLNIESFDQKKKFSTWLYRIATNLTIDFLRKRKPDYSLDADIGGSDGLTLYTQIESNDALPEEQVEGLEFQQWIHKEILKLPPKYRSVIVLKYIDELSLKEISDILNIPIGTVKTRIHRGREALRKQIKKA